MVSEESPGIFRIPVPLPGSPLKAVNAWLVRGTDRSLLIDNGFNSSECELTLLQAFRDLDIDQNSLDFFITHLHSDHCGLTHRLISPESRIYCGRTDGERINAFIKDPGLWPRSLRSLLNYGFPPDELEELCQSHPGKVYASREELAFIWTYEGDELRYGDYCLKVMDCPGHTPGHQVLYEENYNFLISGDHILADISPNITIWEGMRDPLGTYLESLEKILALGVDKIFPGHRNVILDGKSRIRELQQHHKDRLAEILSILADKADASAWEIASRMKWKLHGTWENFPVAQKCFALSEAAAHLEHLEILGKLPKA